jgi:dTDP-4-amino-4,6-dideoxygalactose transaminase
MRENFLVFGQPKIGEDEIEEVVNCMRSGWLGTGPRVTEFEHKFSKYKNIEHAIALNSCTAALHLSLLAAGVGKGDEVITTSLTFCATINAIIHTGAKPVLIDVEEFSMNMDPSLIEENITEKTKAILPVHFAGRLCNMERICKIADKYNLQVIEDCAHAIETEYKGRKAGTFGNFGCFSFYVTKNIVTGEGGMVITNNSENAERIKILGLHGMSNDAWKRFSDEGYKHYEVVECGYKYNMTDMQAAIGVHQMTKIDQFWHRRKEIWEFYNKAFKNLPVGVPAPISSDMKHGYHLYTIFIDEKVCGIERDKFLVQMANNNIGVGVHYLSIPEHKYYKEKYMWNVDNYPNAKKNGRQTVSLPISAKLTKEDCKDVVLAVSKILKESSVL